MLEQERPVKIIIKVVQENHLGVELQPLIQGYPLEQFRELWKHAVLREKEHPGLLIEVLLHPRSHGNWRSREMRRMLVPALEGAE